MISRGIPRTLSSQAVDGVADSWLGQIGQVQTMESCPVDSLAWTHHRRIIHEQAPLRWADFQHSRIRQGARSRQGGPPSRIGEERMGRVTLEEECSRA